MELTIPYNSPESLTNAHARKSTKRNYQIVLSDLECKGHNTSLVNIEIGTLGHPLTATHWPLPNLLPTLSHWATRPMFDDAAKIAIAVSHTNFQVWPDCQNLISWLFSDINSTFMYCFVYLLPLPSPIAYFLCVWNLVALGPILLVLLYRPSCNQCTEH